jgi:transcriptional antiterminator NusG
VDTSHSWFAVWTRSRHEQSVRDQLAMKGIEVYLPTVSRWSRWSDRKKRIDWPLFPGYCFARCVQDLRLPVLNCFGVVNIVSFSGKPAPIPDEQIGAIRLLIASGLEYESYPSLREGNVVEVMHGPLAGVIGRLVRKGANMRLVLSVDTISVAVSVEVDSADVRPFQS